MITGDADAVNPPSVAQALSDKIKGAACSVIDRCGHWATIENPQVSGQRMIEFLRRVDREMRSFNANGQADRTIARIIRR